LQKISLNSDWQFHLGDPKAWRWGPPPQWSWQEVDLPHDWSIGLERGPENPSTFDGGYFPTGFGWYHKAIQAPQSWQGKVVLLEFEGIYMNSAVWIDDHFLGYHPYGYTSFCYDLTPYLRFDGANSLRVGVDNTHQINSRWYSGSGIYRPAWLWVSDPQHIAHWGVSVTTPLVTSESARVSIKTRLVDQRTEPKTPVRGMSLRSTIYDPEGKVVARAEGAVSIAESAQEIEQEMEVRQLALWSPETPSLYSLASELLRDGVVVDQERTPFGIRSLEFSAQRGFLLNGIPLKLKGGCAHHDHGIVGAAAYQDAEARKVRLHKENGYNAIRCAHNPPAPAFLDACDRLGMLVIDESFDCWREGKNAGDYHTVFADWWQRDLESMLLRDRNHPSVILWSIGNELLERNKPEGVKLGRMQADLVRRLDSSRPVTIALCGSGGAWDWKETDGLFAQVDVCGYNYESRNYASDHARLPERIIVGTESTPGEAFEHWMMVSETDYVIGDFVWTSLDYLGESGIGRVELEPFVQYELGRYPWHQANCGDLDLCGFKRPQSFYRDILWKQGSPLFIVVHTPVPEGKSPHITYWGWPDVWPNWNWPGKEGKVLQVDVYSACEQVELLLNGKSFGIQPATRQERFTATFQVPFEAGELKAIGYVDGKPAAEYALATTGAAERIRLSSDRLTLESGEPRLFYVIAEVTDAASQVHPTASNEIFFTVQGPARILAVGSGDPRSTESYTGNQRKAFNGRCLVAVKTSGEHGTIILRAQADGLEAVEIKMQVALKHQQEV
jgi:beta-galactosidase